MTDTPAALTRITDQAEAKARYALVDATIAQLTLSAFPQPVLTQVGTYEDPEWVLVCPWCGKHMAWEDGIIEVDAAVRWNYGTYDPDTEAVDIKEGEKQFDTMVHLAACCETPIDLPELDSCATSGCDQPAPFVLAHARPTCHDHAKDHS